jgi:hypothetical protein
MTSASRQIVELTACPTDDPEGQRVAAVLAAYFKAEHTRAFRRTIWPRLGLGSMIAWLVESLTPLLPKMGLVITLLICAAVAIAAAVAEWRAENTLAAMIATQGARRGKISRPTR